MTEIEKVRQWIYAKNESIGLLKLKIRSIERRVDMAHDWIIEQKRLAKNKYKPINSEKK